MATVLRRLVGVLQATLIALAPLACGGESDPNPNPHPPPSSPDSPEPLVATGPAPDRVVYSNNRVYWSEGGDAAIRSVSASGGTATLLAQRIGSPSAVAFAGEDIIWLDAQTGFSPSGCGVILLLRRTAGGVTTTLETQDNCWAEVPPLVVAGGDAYWVSATASQNPYVIRKTSLAGGASIALVTSTHRIPAMVADGVNLYWLEDEFLVPTAAVRAVPLAGGTPVTLASFSDRAGTFAINATSVIYSEVNSPSSDRLRMVPLGGGDPIDIATVPNTPRKMVSDEAQVYWIDFDGVWSLPLAGGTPTLLARSTNTPIDLIARGDDLIWTETTGPAHGETGTVRQVPKAGGPTQVLVQGGDAPRQLASHPSWLYWTEGGPNGEVEGFGRIARVPTSGGAAETVVSGVVTQTPSIAVTNTHVYIGDRWRIKRVPILGGKVETVAAGNDEIASVAVDATSVFWVSKGLGRVFKAPAAGGAATLLSGLGTSIGPGGPISIQGGRVYWASTYSTIQSVPTAGGTATVVRGDIPFMNDLVADEAALYWSENDTGNIWRVALSGGTPTLMASARAGTERRLAVDGETLAWIDGGAAVAMPKGGGDLLTLKFGISNDPYFVGSIALGQGAAFWTAPPTQQIVTVSKTLGQ